MRFRVHVHPGSSRAEVGGEHDGALVVRVKQRAIDGHATEAVLAALAQVFGVAKRDVQVVSGLASRRKTVQIAGDHIEARLDALLQGDHAS